MRNHVTIISQVKRATFKKTGKKGYVVTFSGNLPKDINGDEVKRIMLSNKQLEVVLQGIGVYSSKEQVLNMSAILLRGARAELSIADRKAGETYTDGEGNKAKYKFSHSDINIDTVQLTASKEDKMLDLAMTTISSTFEDDFDENTVKDPVKAEATAMPE